MNIKARAETTPDRFRPIQQWTSTRLPAVTRSATVRAASRMPLESSTSPSQIGTCSQSPPRCSCTGGTSSVIETTSSNLPQSTSLSGKSPWNRPGTTMSQLKSGMVSYSGAIIMPSSVIAPPGLGCATRDRGPRDADTRRVRCWRHLAMRLCQLERHARGTRTPGTAAAPSRPADLWTSQAEQPRRSHRSIGPGRSTLTARRQLRPVLARTARSMRAGRGGTDGPYGRLVERTGVSAASAAHLVTSGPFRRVHRPSPGCLPPTEDPLKPAPPRRSRCART